MAHLLRASARAQAVDCILEGALRLLHRGGKAIHLREEFVRGIVDRLWHSLQRFRDSRREVIHALGELIDIIAIRVERVLNFLLNRLDRSALNRLNLRARLIQIRRRFLHRLRRRGRYPR